MKEKVITLSNLHGGAFEERFQVELARAAKNLMDPNTLPSAKRTIKMKIVLTTNESRSEVNISFSVKSVLAALKTLAARAFMGRGSEGKLVIVEDDPTQRKLFEEGTNITVMDGGKK